MVTDVSLFWRSNQFVSLQGGPRLAQNNATCLFVRGQKSPLALGAESWAVHLLAQGGEWPLVADGSSLVIRARVDYLRLREDVINGLEIANDCKQ